MTIRQQLLQLTYPLLMHFKRLKADRKDVLFNSKKIPAKEPVYSLSATLANGEQLHFAGLKGKKILIVNTASDCGYTPQYTALQQLQERFSKSLTIVAFPSNDFKQQEPLDSKGIHEFCQRNYGVKFPVTGKSVVKKVDAQHPVYRWLTQQHLNGWNDLPPSWNFSKYLLDEQGNLLAFFPPFVSPLSQTITDAIEQPGFSSFEA